MRLPTGFAGLITSTMAAEMGLFPSPVSSTPVNISEMQWNLTADAGYLRNLSTTSPPVTSSGVLTQAGSFAEINAPLSRSHLLENKNNFFLHNSATTTRQQDGLERLGIPLLCIATAVFIFGAALFVKKVVQEDDPPTNHDDTENFVLNGDDVMYLLPDCEDTALGTDDPDFISQFSTQTSVLEHETET